jgi:hypothetical protein
MNNESETLGMAIAEIVSGVAVIVTLLHYFRSRDCPDLEFVLGTQNHRT